MGKETGGRWLYLLKKEAVSVDTNNVIGRLPTITNTDDAA